MVPASTSAIAIDTYWGICLGVNILRLEWSETLSEKNVASMFIGNILLSKAPNTLSLPSKGVYDFLKISFFFCFLSGFCDFIFFLNSKFQLINLYQFLSE